MAESQSDATPVPRKGTCIESRHDAANVPNKTDLSQDPTIGSPEKETGAASQESFELQGEPSGNDMSPTKGKHRSVVAFWVGLLLLTIAFSAWAILKRSGREPISVNAQIQAMEPLWWQIAIPTIGDTPYATNLRPVRITARDISFYGWNGVKFIFYIFADAPFVGSAKSYFGGSDKTLKSDQLNLSAQDPLHLRVDPYKGPTWRSLEYSTSVPLTIKLISFVPNSGPPTKPGRFPHLHGVAQVTGKAGSRFELKTRDSSDCVPDCTGQFSNFEGSTLPSDPPQFRGQGADGINKITVNSTADANRGGMELPILGPTQGFQFFAQHVTELAVEEYVEQVSLSAKEGQFNFNGQTIPLVQKVPLNIKFDKSNVGHMQISQGDPPSLRLGGIAQEVQFGDENLMPRIIDKLPWYVQLIIGSVITFCAERLFALSRWAGDAPTRRSRKNVNGQSSADVARRQPQMNDDSATIPPSVT